MGVSIGCYVRLYRCHPEQRCIQEGEWDENMALILFAKSRAHGAVSAQWGHLFLTHSKALYELIVALSAYIFPVWLASLFLDFSEVPVFHIPYNLQKEV